MKKILPLTIGLLILATLMVPVAFLNASGAGLPACADYSYKQCISNISYWYDSCGNIQAVAQNCNLSNQICKNAVCVRKATTPAPVPKPSITPPTLHPTPITTQPAINSIVAIFVKKDAQSGAWQKTIQAANSDTLTFIVVVKNISTKPVNNVSVSVALTGKLAYTGNLTIDSATSLENISTGVNLGNLASGASKAMTFTAAVQTADTNTILPVASVNAGDLHDTDYVSVNVPVVTSVTPEPVTTPITPPVAPPAAPKAPSFFSGILSSILKRWYLWVIAAVVLFILFMIIFRRLSNS